MPHLVEEVNNLNIKLDAALEFATFLRSVNMIQDFNGIEREEHRREIETFKAIQKLFDITGQGQDTTEDRVAHQLSFQKFKEDMSLRLQDHKKNLQERSCTAKRWSNPSRSREEESTFGF